MKQFPQSFLDKLNSVTNKRPATVIQHILKHGYITTEELKDIYGYNHPPRAIRDVREQNEQDIDMYMLLSPSANRAKSWTCEHCVNWEKRDASFCMNCFWAYPEHYTHIAGHHQHRIILTFTGDEIEDYNKQIALVGEDKAEETIKDLIHRYLK